MQIEIWGREVKVSERLREYIERRVRFALERLAMPIRKVHVQLRDLNGPRGGVDKSCKVRIALAPAATLVVEHRSSSAYAAIDSALKKAAMSIVRRIQRKQERIRTRTATSRIEQTLT
jgi:putative sigma-54 modulation protein